MKNSQNFLNFLCYLQFLTQIHSAKKNFSIYSTNSSCINETLRTILSCLLFQHFIWIFLFFLPSIFTQLLLFNFGLFYSSLNRINIKTFECVKVWGRKSFIKHSCFSLHCCCCCFLLIYHSGFQTFLSCECNFSMAIYFVTGFLI